MLVVRFSDGAGGLYFGVVADDLSVLLGNVLNYAGKLDDITPFNTPMAPKAGENQTMAINENMNLANA